MGDLPNGFTFLRSLSAIFLIHKQTSISPRVVSKVVLILDRHSLFSVSFNEISVQIFL